MPPRHRVSRAAIALIKQFEGYRPIAAKLPDGRWTLGYGHTLTARGGAEVSEADAEALLFYDLIAVAHAVSEHVYAPLGVNQFDALCSFTFNLGIDAFLGSQMLKRLNAGDTLQAACAMDMWRRVEFDGERIVLDALVRRRAVEKALFLTPDDARWTPAASAVLRPLLDGGAQELVPIHTPEVIITHQVGDDIRVSRPDAVYRLEAFEAGAAVKAAAEGVGARLEPIFATPAAAAPPNDLEEVGAVDAPGAPIFNFPASDGHGEQALAIPPPPSPAEPDSLAGLEVAPILPSRIRPPAVRREPSVVWDLLLMLVGLGFFGFGLLWGLSPQASMAPMLVAWSGGLAGVVFASVAVFRLLSRLGRTRDRDG